MKIAKDGGIQVKLPPESEKPAGAAVGSRLRRRPATGRAPGAARARATFRGDRPSGHVAMACTCCGGTSNMCLKPQKCNGQTTVSGSSAGRPLSCLCRTQSGCKRQSGFSPQA